MSDCENPFSFLGCDGEFELTVNGFKLCLMCSLNFVVRSIKESASEDYGSRHSNCSDTY